MTLDRQMFEAAIHGKKVRVICTDGTEYVGMADMYSQADDEECGYSSFYVDDPDHPLGLFENQIVSIDVLD